ncbi:unnamed protein product, partial [Scytosiphon promiscuus]
MHRMGGLRLVVLLAVAVAYLASVLPYFFRDTRKRRTRFLIRGARGLVEHTTGGNGVKEYPIRFHLLFSSPMGAAATRAGASSEPGDSYPSSTGARPCRNNRNRLACTLVHTFLSV